MIKKIGEIVPAHLDYLDFYNCKSVVFELSIWFFSCSSEFELLLQPKDKNFFSQKCKSFKENIKVVEGKLFILDDNCVDILPTKLPKEGLSGQSMKSIMCGKYPFILIMECRI